MKVLYITNGIIGAGGLERVLAIKASYLADTFGHEVHILTLNQGGQEPFYQFSPKIILHDIAVGGHPVQYLQQYKNGIQSVVNGIKPNIISVCDDGLKGFFLPLLLGNSCPVIYERHVSKIIAVGENPGFLKKIRTRIQFSMMNALAKRFDRFVVLTDENLSEWNLGNSIVISNPLSFYPAESSALNQKRVIAVGKQGYQKGYDLLLQAWHQTHERFPDWTLDIYGKFDQTQNLEGIRQKLQLQNAVHFHPPTKDIQTKYLESSVYVMSSRFEGFGMVLIEAMACGVPCVSFNCPYGPSDIIANGSDGLLAKNGDVSDLAAKLATLMENDSMRVQMGKKAKENVTRYHPDVIVKQWDALFKELIAKNNK